MWYCGRTCCLMTLLEGAFWPSSFRGYMIWRLALTGTMKLREVTRECLVSGWSRKKKRYTFLWYIENGLNCIVKYDPLTFQKEVYDKPKHGLNFEILPSYLKCIYHKWLVLSDMYIVIHERGLDWVFPITYIIISHIHQPTTVNVQCYIPPSMPDGKCGTWRVECYRRKN